jgi:aryl-alcohol dehydrogenase-like predicted oxidoreductase
MRTRIFGDTGREVGAVGLGCMGMSWAYNESERNDARSAEVIRSALDLGVTFLDTANVYGDGHNESVVGAALAGRRDDAFLATKVGLVVDDLFSKSMHRDGSPEHIRDAADASLRRLGTDVIDLYYLHRIDPAVPLEQTWSTMAELVEQGKVRHLGLSEVSVDQAATAHAIHPVAAVQSEFSLWWTTARGETAPTDAVTGQDRGGAPFEGASGDVVGWCADHGAAFVPFAPLGRGFLTGAVTENTTFEPGDVRTVHPRFQTSVREANLRIIDSVRTVAARYGATPAQIALAWVLAQGGHILPIPGTKQLRYLTENTAAASIDLTEHDLAVLQSLPAAVGSRY